MLDERDVMTADELLTDIRMEEVMTRLRLCTTKVERTIGILKSANENLDYLKQELKDIDDLLFELQGEE